MKIILQILRELKNITLIIKKENQDKQIRRHFPIQKNRENFSSKIKAKVKNL